nr:aromatic amino acid DMT transporter YddG [Edaphocola aurantiacus]
MNHQNKGTAVGLCAIILWSLIVSLIKEVSHYFGATGGAALIYTLASVLLLLTVGWTPLKQFPRKYLIYGSLLMVAYEVCLALSIGYSTTSRQAVEVGMVNYLWPSLTMVALIIFHKKRTNWLIVPGVLLSMTGIVWVLGGEQGLYIGEMIANIQTNPLSYGLAFIGAIIWSAYCVITARMARGTNGITLFFILVALVLWFKYLLVKETTVLDFNLRSCIFLVLAACAMGLGYAAWNVGMLKGNTTVLAGASYFIPVLSSAISSVLLQTALGIAFWQGAVMVCLGSVLCWFATRTQKART